MDFSTLVTLAILSTLDSMFLISCSVSSDNPVNNGINSPVWWNSLIINIITPYRFTCTKKHINISHQLWVARLTRNVEVVGSSPLEQETLPLLLSTGWFQERIRV